MTAVLITLLVVLPSFVAGYIARDVRDKIIQLHGYWRDKIERPTGVVRPTLRPTEQAQGNSLTGSTRPLSPAEYRAQENAKMNRR
jgi:hypothetical protein